MKKNKGIFFLVFLFLLTFTISCQKKEVLNDSSTKLFSSKSLSQKMVTSGADKQVPIEWLRLHDRYLKGINKQNFEEIIRNLDYSLLYNENRKNGENLIIIPINNLVIKQLNINKDYLKLDERTILNLMIVQGRNGKLRWSSIIAYLPADGVKRTQLSRKTIQNIINGEKVSDDGMFKFIDLKGNLKYQMSYKSGKLHSVGIPKTNLKNISYNQGNSSARSHCLNWFLDTIYYYADGSTEQTSEYLFTTCDDQNLPGGGGGGGSGENPEPEEPEDETEEPNDQDIIVSGSSQSYESEFVDEDIAIDPPQESEVEVDENGNTIIPVPAALPVLYIHSWSYSYSPIGPFYMKTVTMSDATVHPANQTYNTSTGWMTKNITLLDMHKNAQEMGTTAVLRWNYYAHTRWTNTTTSVTRVTQRAKTHVKTIPF
ncbi:hypothetical protein [Pedobacter sp. N23S346]|uniref:hypothetical protein n=1 Tax=Pedobacter sp. N23S346 TaxID=3402750 RepID=UPI003ACA73D2